MPPSVDCVQIVPSSFSVRLWWPRDSQPLQHLAALRFIPDTRVQWVLCRGAGLLAATAADRGHLDEGTGQLAVPIQCHIRVVVLRDTADADTPGAALRYKAGGVSHDPLPLCVRVGRFQAAGDAVVDVAEQRLHERLVRVSVWLYLLDSPCGAPVGEHLRQNNPEAPCDKHGGQQHSAESAAGEGQDDDHHANQDGDAAPKGSVLLHFCSHLFLIFSLKTQKRGLIPTPSLDYGVSSLFISPESFSGRSFVVAHT